jgi:hypothetical protein
MKKRSYAFLEKYKGLLALGLDRKTDESTIICMLQMFSDDNLMETLIKRLSDDELDEIHSMIMRLMKTHLKESEYHRLFLKD